MYPGDPLVCLVQGCTVVYSRPKGVFSMSSNSSTARRAVAAAAVATPVMLVTMLGPAAAATANGPTVSTPYGPVAVSVTVKGGKVTKVVARKYPTKAAKSRKINARAIPKLKAQALKSSTGNIAGVSGATATSNGFRSSLQAALSQV